MINDVKPDGNNISTFKYVDDMSIVECRNSSQPSNIQNSIDSLVGWCDQNKIKLNPSKCLHMNVNFMRKPPIYPTFAIGTHNLETVTQMKVLGVIIQNDLKWDRNVDNIVKRANSKIHMLRVLKCHGLPSHDLMTIYS